MIQVAEYFNNMSSRYYRYRSMESITEYNSTLEPQPRYGRQYDDYQKIIHGVTSERDIKDAIAALQDRFQRLQFMLEDCQDAYRKKHEILQKRNEYMQTSGTINIITTASLILLCLSLISSLVRVALIGNYLSD